MGQHPPLDKNWQVVFEDDFSTFDRSRWRKQHNLNRAWGIYEEQQVYDSTNVYIENDKLVLRTKVHSNYPCPRGSNCAYGGYHNYTSGEVDSKDRFHYGYFEIYAQVSGSSGYFPAFWLWYESVYTANPTPYWYNEIDIFEAKGDKIDSATSNIHLIIGKDPEICRSPLPAVPHALNYTSGYHWYGVEWNKDKITWYYARKTVRQLSNNICNPNVQNPMIIIMNVALDSRCTGCPNQILPTTQFPNYMYVEQANVYKLKFDCDTTVTEITNYDNPQLPNYYDYKVKKSISLSGVSSLTSGQNVSLRATDYIELTDGFYVPSDAELYLDNNPCEVQTIKKKQGE